MFSLKVIDFDNFALFEERHDLHFDVKFNDKLVASSIRMHLLNRRGYSRKCKSMSDISCSTAKPHSQKGSGRARQGSKRSVQFVGGRKCFGPIIRNFNYTVPKKILLSSFSQVIKRKIENGKFLLFNFLGTSILKTKEVSSFLLNNNFSNILVVFDDDCYKKDNMNKSIRNIKNISIKSFSSLGFYDIVNSDFVFLQHDLIKPLKEKIKC